jgi:hypothetical protein
LVIEVLALDVIRDFQTDPVVSATGVETRRSLAGVTPARDQATKNCIWCAKALLSMAMRLINMNPYR